ncbi:hypothetical protein [Terrabacter lapilli]
MRHTDPVMPEMSGTTGLDDASSALSARAGAGLVEHPRVDLLAADPGSRHLPEGAVAGFALLGALVLLSCLVGGPTGGFVVVGVSTLLTTCAGLVTGHLSLGQVGGQRSASALLGVGAAALILGSVVSEHDRPAPGVAAGTPVPVSAESAVQASRTYAAGSATPSRSVPVTVASASPTGSAGPVTDAGLTLSPDALAPRPTEGVEGGVDGGTGKGTGAPRPKGSEQGTGQGSEQGTAQGTGKAGPAVDVAPRTPQASHAKPAVPAQAAKGATAKPGKSKPGKSKPAQSKPAKSRPPVAVRHGFAIVASAVRDLL